MSRHRWSPLALAAVALLGASPADAAEIEPLRLVSASPREQADRAGVPALSADGRYVAFSGSLGGQRGVFRTDLQTRAVVVVAGGGVLDPVGAVAPGDADRPSISADGRYVSFVTASRLDPSHDPNGVRDVYVRDLAVAAPDGGQCPATGACAFTLASARDGSADALIGGATASARSALSADGRRLAFVTLGASDLTSGPGGSTPGVATPAGQVAVRDLDANRTTLVSASRDPHTGAMTGLPVAQGAVASTATFGAGTSSGPGAALSADGTTVAWLGTQIAAQVPTVAGEAVHIDEAVRAGGYNEPLWRRIADGPAAPTRRIVGGGDPLAPGCPPGGAGDVPACQGPFPDLTVQDPTASVAGWIPGSLGFDAVPRLSADGRIVALLGKPDSILAANAFVVDMRDGLTRAQAIRQLTRQVLVVSRTAPPASGLDDERANAPLLDIAISPDGRRLAVATARQQFPLAPPTLVGGAPQRLGLPELYRVDLDGDVIERVTAPAGGDASLLGGGQSTDQGAGATSPTFSGDGRRLAFASRASNLVPGDANGQSDVFVATDPVVVDAPPSFELSPLPRPRPFVPAWRMDVRARTMRDGTVHVDLALPGAGTVRLSARARVAVRRTYRRRKVASVRRTVRRDGIATLVLRPNKSYRKLAAARRGLVANMTVAFAARSRPTLEDGLDVLFRQRKRAKKSAVRRATPTRGDHR